MYSNNNNNNGQNHQLISSMPLPIQPPSSPGIIIGNGKQQHHILKNKSKTPLPADPIDPDFQYTISPSKSLKTKASSSNNNNYYYSGNKKIIKKRIII